MSEIGLRVGPFEIVEPASVPESGRWFVARRVGTSSRGPSEVLVKLPHDPAHGVEIGREFERVRDLRDGRVPEPVGYWEGAGALAVGRVRGVPVSSLLAAPDRLEVGVVTWLEVVCDLAESLQRAHDKGLLHGHLDGAHVWVAPDGRLWLWGLGPGPRTEPHSRWAAPERALRLAPSAQTDEWSLGALLLAILTGAPPGDLGRLPEVDARLQAVRSRWPGLARVLRKMLDPSPEHRYPGVHAARAELLAQIRQIGGVSERRALGQWVAAHLEGPVPEPDEDAEDEATVLVSPERVSAELAALRDERAQATRAKVAEPTWPGFDAPAVHDQEATMLFSDRHRLEGESDTDLNKRIPEAVYAEDEDSLARTLDRAAVPHTGEIREVTDEGTRPLDLPIDSPTAERYSVPAYVDEDQSGPYHAAIDLTEIDTAPNEASFVGPSPLPLPPRRMSGPERLASGLLATLAALTLIWFLVRVLG